MPCARAEVRLPRDTPEMSSPPADRVVLVTGASAGIGLATAERLSAAGWRVVGASRRGSAPGRSVWKGLVMDVDDDESVHLGVAELLASHGRLDAVVAGAGWGLAGPVEHTPLEDAKAQFETNFFGVVRVVSEALGPMRAGAGGRVVIVSSLAGVVGIPFQSFYSASKFALEGYGEALAYEVAPFGIDVTLVQPGNVRTEFTARRRRVVPPPRDPYDAAMERAVGVMERDEAAGAAPELVARAIEGVLDSHRPPRRVSVGKAGERMGVFAKRLLPYRAFERAARSSLGV